MTDTAADITHLTDDDILALVQSGARKLDRQIRQRDWREIIAAAVAAIVIAPEALRGPMVARTGAWLVLSGLVLIVWRLLRAQRLGGRGAANPALPVAAALRAERQRLDVQIALLENVAWWYVALPGIGVIVLTTGVRGASWFTLAYGVAVALLSWGIVGLNTSAVRRTLRPRRTELGALLAQLELPAAEEALPNYPSA